MISNHDLKDEWFIIPVIILFAILLIRVYWTFIRIQEYPFERIPDAGNHIIFLFFLVKYGFHQLVPNYWNGFILFSNYTPGWHFLSLPLYYLTKDVVFATFLSLVQSLSLGLIFVFILGHLMRLSIIKRIVFFLLFFASPPIMDYMQIGRYPELTGWVLFIPFFTLIMWYKDHKLNKKFLLFIPLYSIILLTHVYVLYVASFLVISLFLIKKFKEKVIIVLSFLLSLILTSFWWNKAFVFMFTNTNTRSLKGSFELLDTGSIISYNTLILVSFLIVFYFYFKSYGKIKKRELLFYSPLLILSLLILTRLIVLVPVLNTAFIMPYNMFFLFMTIYLFFNIDWKIVPVILKRVFPIFLIILAVSMFTFSFMRVDYSKRPHSLLREEFLSILPYIEGRYIPISVEGLTGEIPYDLPKICDCHVMDYAIMYYNLSTPLGTTHPGGIVPTNVKETFKQLYGCSELWEECPKERKALDCETIKYIGINQNVRSLISSDDGCDLLKKCGFKEKIKKEKVCLFLYETIPL